MKKLVTLATILLMATAFSSHSNAQCIGCSQGVAPTFSQPVNAVQSYGTSVYDAAPAFNSTSVYDSSQVYGSTPVYNSAPVYGSTPVYDSAPVYNSAPAYDSAPVYGSAEVYNSTPVYDSTPSYSAAPAPVSYSEPIYGSPIVSAPVDSYSSAPIYSQSQPISYPIATPLDSYPSSTGSCCGGVVSGGVVGQPIYDNYSSSPIVSEGWAPGTIIEGGTVIGETVVVSTPSTGEQAGDSASDSVSPPTPVAAEEAVSPVPDETPVVEKKKAAKKKKANKKKAAKGPQEDDGT